MPIFGIPEVLTYVLLVGDRQGEGVRSGNCDFLVTLFGRKVLFGDRACIVEKILIVLALITDDKKN